MTDDEITQLAINTIRTLSIDAVQQAKSGHPGALLKLDPMFDPLRNHPRFKALTESSATSGSH